MPIIGQQTRAQLLLARLQTIYPTPHNDTATERLECEKLLEAAFHAGLSEDILASKLLAISKAHGTHRRKLSTLITGQFWEQSVQQAAVIQARGYEVPGPRVVDKWSLEP